jgi:septal ring-binding cell division protein DamX
MESLEATMKKHNIHLNTSLKSYLGQALSASAYASSSSGYALNVSSSSSSHEWLIDSGASYHMGKDKVVFSTLQDCNTKKFLLVMVDLLVLKGLAQSI